MKTPNKEKTLLEFFKNVPTSIIRRDIKACHGTIEEFGESLKILEGNPQQAGPSTWLCIENIKGTIDLTREWINRLDSVLDHRKKAKAKKRKDYLKREKDK